MGWVRIDDSFYDHPGHAGLDLAAWGLWAWSLAWSNRNLTDGHIPLAVVKRMDPVGDATGALIASSRWDLADEVVVVHDFLEYQPSAEQIREKRERERVRWQRRGGRKPSPDGEPEDSETTPRGVDAEHEETPPASQPQPQDLSHDKSLPAEDRRRGTRIPEDFDLSADRERWAHERCPGLDVVLHHERFVNHWRAKTGRDATKLDWDATWRNWMLREHAARPIAMSPRPPADEKRRCSKCAGTGRFVERGEVVECDHAPLRAAR